MASHSLIAKGDCYEASAHAIIGFASRVDVPADAVLVHGRPTLTRPPYIEYGHAWLEYTADGMTWCLNVANGDDKRLPGALFYGIGNIDPEQCYRYNREQASHMLAAYEHYGPWEGVEGEPPLNPEHAEKLLEDLRGRT